MHFECFGARTNFVKALGPHVRHGAILKGNFVGIHHLFDIVVLNVDVFCSLVVHWVLNECKASLAINPNFCGLIMKEAKLMQQTFQLHASLASLVEKNAIVSCFLLAQFVTPFFNKRRTLPWIFKSLNLCPNLNLKSLSKSHS
jgi:hypothetical protein